MIQAAEHLLPFYHDLFVQLSLFLDSRGADSRRYSVAPAGHPIDPDELVSVRYDRVDHDDGDYLASVTAACASGPAQFGSGLRTALNFLSGLFDDEAYPAELAAFDANAAARDAARLLGVDPDLVHDHVDRGSAGRHLAVSDGRALLYQVEDRGETFPLAESASPALLVYLLHAQERRTRDDVASRFAEFVSRTGV